MLRWPAAALVLVLWALTPAAAAQPAGEAVSRAQELVDAGQVEEALELLDRALARRPRADALLLRSTIRFMQGDLDAGRTDLDRALELDPGLRQGWLNRAALDISDQRLDRALEALQNARDLDPAAADNDLNIGAVKLLQGELAAASSHFERYLEREGASAGAYLLVASNFAMGGYEALALRHLRRAIELDERTRLRARTDPNFSALVDAGEFRLLLDHDGYRPPPGSHSARRVFDSPYQQGRGRMLQAVMNALQLSGRPFESQVEVTPGWALIWSDFRIKIRAEAEASAAVELTAPAERFSPGEWQRQSDAFFREITIELARMNRPF